MKLPFSVLISVYAKEKPEFLSEALRSVIEQTVVPDEIILVEDGPLTIELSSVIDIYRKNANLVSVKLPENVGLARALNEGLKHCSNELVARMDSDDISYSDRFEKQIKVFEENPEISICGGWISEFSNDPMEITGYRRTPLSNKKIIQYFKKMCPMNHVTVMYKKSVVCSVGGYEPSSIEDYWLWAKLISNGSVFKNIPQILVNVRGGTEMSKRRGGQKYIRSEIKFQKAILRLGLINKWECVNNILVRSFVRVLPNSCRSMIYKCIRVYQNMIK